MFKEKFLHLIRKTAWILLIFSAIISIGTFCIKDVSADVGGQISHSSGGSSSSSSSHSSSSFGSSHSGGSGDFSIGSFLFTMIIIGIIFYSNIQSAKNGGNINKVYTNEKQNISPQEELAIIESIQRIDPAFDEELFKTWAEEVFVTLQEAWTEKEWKKIRPFESDALFATHAKQLNDLIDKGLTNRVERIAIRDTKISEFETKGANETVSVIMKVSLRDYYVDDKTNRIVEGNPNQEIFVVYKLKFVRTAGVKTTNLSTKSVTNCPNCGAPTEITSSGQCPYCKSVITTGEYTFVLASLKALSQRS